MKDFLHFLGEYVLSKDIDSQKHLSAYIIGCGLSGLAAGYFLVSKTFVPGHHVHLLERKSFPGGKYSDNPRKQDTFVMPFVHYLQKHDVRFHYDTNVSDVTCASENGVFIANRIEVNDNGRQCAIDLTESDMVFSTIGAVINAENFVPVGMLSGMLRDKLLEKSLGHIS